MSATDKILLRAKKAEPEPIAKFAGNIPQSLTWLQHSSTRAVVDETRNEFEGTLKSLMGSALKPSITDQQIRLLAVKLQTLHETIERIERHS